MARVIGPPRLPDTPGTWLAIYRYRRWVEGEVSSSPERIAELLGVSGPTIRRWETGMSKPTYFDLQTFAEVCRLSPIEKSFITTAFEANEYENPPSRPAFADSVQRILSIPFPANLYDSMFYRRAYNSYMSVVGGANPPINGNSNALNTLLSSSTGFVETESHTHRFQRWLHDFWFATADLCGSLPYRRVLKELSALPGFADEWRRIGLQRDEWQSWSYNAPHMLYSSSIGCFCVFPSKVILPPTYHLRVWIPVDELAVRRLDEERSHGPPNVIVDDEIHWSSRFVKSG